MAKTRKRKKEKGLFVGKGFAKGLSKLWKPPKRQKKTKGYKFF